MSPFLKAIETRRISEVVVWKLDRLVRRPAEFERFWASCEEVGAILVSATEPIDTSTDLGVALVRILVSFAGLESATMGLRIRAKKEEQARAGIPSGKIGFGLTGRSHVRIVTKEARLIREGAQRVLEGASAYAITEDWNRRGIPSPERALWQTNSVKKLLLADRVFGDRVYQGHVVARDCWPAILDRETQTRLRIILRAPSDRRPGRQMRLLTGLIHCGSCGGPLRGTRVGRHQPSGAHRHRSAAHIRRLMPPCWMRICLMRLVIILRIWLASDMSHLRRHQVGNGRIERSNSSGSDSGTWPTTTVFIT